MARELTIVSQCFFPEENTTSQILATIGAELVRRNVRVDVIAGQPTYFEGATKVPKELVHEGMTVRRVWSLVGDKNRALARAGLTMSFTVSAGAALLAQRRQSPVLMVTNPPQLHWLGAILETSRRPTILLVHDVYPDIAEELGALPRGGGVARGWRALNRQSYGRAAAIVSLGRDMTDRLREYVPRDRWHRIVEITNYAEHDLVKPRARLDHPLLVELGLQDKFVFLYSGNIGLFHEVQSVLAAARALADTRAHFLFIGGGAQANLLRECGLPNVSWLPFQPHERLPLTLTACDVSLVTLKREALGLCVPSKLYTAMATGRPVLCVTPERSETSLTVSREQCGWVSSPDDPITLERLVRQIIATSPGQLDDMGRRARSAAISTYDVKHAVDQYEALLTGGSVNARAS